MKFRPLTAVEVEARVSQVKETGVVLLLYKDARCDMRILDETVGSENWQREHYDCKGNLFCRVGINTNYDNQSEDRWVWKSDCGTESNTEAQKGEASDSFKRACFNWGIGRELYTAPFIWIPSSECKIEKNYKGNLVCYDRFSVSDMAVENGKIVALTIKNKGKIVFQLDQPVKISPTACVDCGQIIEDTHKRNGEVWRATDVVSYSTKRFSRVLCPDCQKKAFVAEKEGQNDRYRPIKPNV